ncbi:hypothetical protein KFL_013680020 [Klebsormidium nitens]|uniref:Reverse transcriptase Ty1/copia-type domain-containing protein n=1 Tax=Klebsormidium nitens TaxID=105231 RepID=A0A1Y1IUE0_KLENI|nr:hypothetical protein KFL_013680020 [Klebsormidium nitens]|eukprot:GAQ93219.1 hypothetical protein KFL_013680020 [Klebsormidium nitens]
MQQPQGYDQAVSISECVGSLLDLSVCTRPDIAQAVGALARYMAGPTKAHWRAALGGVRYLTGTAEDGVTFGRSEEALIDYCDADYAGDGTRSSPQRSTSS